MFCGLLLQLLPQVGILDGLFIGSTPAAGFPAGQPFVHAFLYVLRIGVYPHLARAFQGFESLDHGHQFHAVIGSIGLATANGFFTSAMTQQGAPAPQTGVALAGTIGPNIDNISHVLLIPSSAARPATTIGRRTRRRFFFHLGPTIRKAGVRLTALIM